MTQWGMIVAIGWIGERYYWMEDEYGSIAMIDAFTVEQSLV